MMALRASSPPPLAGRGRDTAWRILAPGTSSPPPLAGGGRGEGSVRETLRRFPHRTEPSRPPRRSQLPDPRQHAVQIVGHVIAPESQHNQSLRVHPAIPGGVGREIRVRRAVDLHHQSGGRAEEIRDVRTDRGLATKFQPVDLPGAECPPQPRLPACRVAAHGACVMRKTGGRVPSPRPPPARGGGALAAILLHSMILQGDREQGANVAARHQGTIR